MNEIKCPHCGTVFTIDEADYASLVQQVRTAEFEKELHRRLTEAEKAKKAEIELAETKAAQQAQEAAAKKDAEIQRLKAELDKASTTHELVLAKTVSAMQQKLDRAENKLALQEAEQKVTVGALKESHSKEMALKDDLIERVKDMKAKLSVKLLGEDLEQHCEIEFSRMRALAFPNAKFGKDNDASGGTKGDYVFRDFNDDGVEYISIMFEMK
ncbi:MAG: DUF2130 domain-containing protein, partial [Actinomycetia bacterium]|nr:DUF2130 domain-containing protein [Actinomycetes bacterium]